MAFDAAFNPQMLVLARESRGLTQNDLAGQAGISQGELSKIETGLRVPADEQVHRLAGCLKYAVEFFYLTEQVRSLSGPCIYSRKRVSTPERVLRRLLAIVNVRRIQLRRLLLSVELDVENGFECMDIEDHDFDAEGIARKVRALWGLPPGPLVNLVAAIEQAGGIVMRCDFGTLKVDALSQWVAGMPPIFFVNAAMPMDRVRFTLAHEIGHIVMHRIPTDNMEKEADRFAAELLMPAVDIRPQLDDLTLPRLASLKPYWRTSMAALLKRAGDLRTITPRTRSFLWTQMGKFGYRRVEPVSIPWEEPTLIDEIIQVHSTDFGYKSGELTRLLHITDEAETVRLYLPKTSRGLRVVG